MIDSREGVVRQPPGPHFGAAGLFVTGTDTGVGKTWVAAGLLAACARRGLQTAAMKPVASGCVQSRAGLRNEDALVLAAAATSKPPYDLVNPYAFASAIAPHIAAMEAGVCIDFDVIATRLNRLRQDTDVVIVEGVGGWRVPLNERETVAELAVTLGLPVVMVVGMRLGCLSHALLTFESIERSGVGCAGWIANTIQPDLARFDENLDALRTRLPVPLVGVVPHFKRFDANAVARSLALADLQVGSERRKGRSRHPI